MCVGTPTLLPALCTTVYVVYPPYRHPACPPSLPSPASFGRAHHNPQYAMAPLKREGKASGFGFGEQGGGWCTSVGGNSPASPAARAPAKAPVMRSLRGASCDCTAGAAALPRGGAAAACGRHRHAT
jgi:hypothetical protein